MCLYVCVFFIRIVCACDPVWRGGVGVCVGVHAHVYDQVCVCLCVFYHALNENVYKFLQVCLHTTNLYIYMGICALHGFVKFVKHFESPEVLYKFPIIIIIIIIIIIHSHSLVLDLAPRPLELAASWTSLSPAPWMVPRMLCSCRAQ